MVVERFCTETDLCMTVSRNDDRQVCMHKCRSSAWSAGTVAIETRGNRQTIRRAAFSLPRSPIRSTYPAAKDRRHRSLEPKLKTDPRQDTSKKTHVMEQSLNFRACKHMRLGRGSRDLSIHFSKGVRRNACFQGWYGFALSRQPLKDLLLRRSRTKLAVCGSQLLVSISICNVGSARQR